jgi:hypothetical protein
MHLDAHDLIEIGILIKGWLRRTSLEAETQREKGKERAGAAHQRGKKSSTWSPEDRRR